MFNPVSSSRIRAVRALRWQGYAALAVALVCLALPNGGVKSAVAAVSGGALIVLAGALSLTVALGGGIASGAGMALGRVVAAVFMKWGVVALGMLILMGVLKLPPLPLLTAIVASVGAYIAANAIPDKVS